MSCSDKNCGGCHSKGNSGGCHSKGDAIDIDFGFETLTCSVLNVLTINDQEYIILQHPLEKMQLLYRYNEINGNITLDVIDGEEFDLVARAYESIR